MRATPPLPLSLTLAVPVAPNKTTEDATTMALRTPTPTATPMPRTTALITARMENTITIQHGYDPYSTSPLYYFTLGGIPNFRFLNPRLETIQRMTTTANVLNPRLSRSPALGWGSPTPQRQQ